MSDDGEVIRWYTKARKFPKFIGKAGLSNTPIPGGPYPVSGVVAFVVAFLIGAQTMGLWSTGHLLYDGGILVLLSFGAGFAAGKLAVDGRNPLTVVAGAWRAVRAPRLGTFAGRPMRLPHPQRVTSRVNVANAVPEAEAPTEEPTAAAAPAESPVHRMANAATRGNRELVLSGVQALLAGAPLDRR